MNIYELVEVLRRQIRLLTVGGVILVLIVAIAWLAVPPKYTVTLRLMVVDDGITDLTDERLARSDFSRIAAIYGDLLLSAEAKEEITAKEGIEIGDLRVTALSQTSSLEIAVDSSTAEGAVAAALESYSWLKERLQQSEEIVFTPFGTTTTQAPTVADASGRMVVNVDLVVETFYADVDSTFWLGIDTLSLDAFATPLALLGSGMSFEAVIYTDSLMAVNIGPEIGLPFDSVQLRIPDLPENPAPGIALKMQIKRGAVLFTEDSATLNPFSFSLSWENPPAALDEQAQVAILLMNPDLTAVPVGQRRGPIISGAILMLGVAGLLILATAFDGWQRFRQESIGEPNARSGATPESRESV